MPDQTSRTRPLAAGQLAEASDIMMAHPLALQLRNLQTLIDISVDKNSTVIFPCATFNPRKPPSNGPSCVGSIC